MTQKKTGLIVLCDREHGPMERTVLIADARDHIPAFRCTFPGCGRVYTPSLGYRDLHGNNPAQNRDAGDPRCSSHRRYLCVKEEMADHDLLYICPEVGCTEEIIAKAKPDQTGI
jgi:hypothetical protein